MGLCVMIPRRFARFAAMAACVCLLGAAMQLRAENQSRKENRREDARQIEFMERTWLHALTTADTTTLEKMMSEDFVAVSAGGTLSDKPQYLQHIKVGDNQFDQIHVMEIKVRMRPAAAVVVSQVHATGRIDNRPVNGVFRYTKVYGRDPNGEWRVMSIEATSVSGEHLDSLGMYRGIPLHERVEH